MLEVTGRTLNSSSVALPAIVIVLAVADTIHIVSHYLSNLNRHPRRGRRELMAETLDEVLTPCALTTFTKSTVVLEVLVSAIAHLEPLARALGEVLLRSLRQPSGLTMVLVLFTLLVMGRLVGKVRREEFSHAKR